MTANLALQVLTIAAGLLILAPSTASSQASAGETCGGYGNVRCAAGLMCEYRFCSAPDNSGICIAVPTACTREYRPVCGCDGKTYGNDCDRRAAKVTKRSDGTCK